MPSLHNATHQYGRGIRAMTEISNNVKARPRRGPAWVYVLGGALGLQLAGPLLLSAWQLRPADFGVPSPAILALFGVLLGGKAYLLFSKPLPVPSKRP
jgi:hypothetical protein